MSFSFFEKSERVQAFPSKPHIIEKMLSFLEIHGVAAFPKENEECGTIPHVMFNELCAFGFEPSDVENVLESYFYDDYFRGSEEPKDVGKTEYYNRCQKHRNALIMELLLTLPLDKIPVHLGGQSVEVVGESTLQHLEESDSIILPFIKAGERKPRSWRKVSYFTFGENMSEEQISIELVKKTQLVSEPLVEQVVSACDYKPIPSYLTAITSVLLYKKGEPRIPNELKAESSIENWVTSIRQNEFELIEESGFNIQNYTETKPKELRPYCYIGYEIWIVKVHLDCLQEKGVTLYFHLQDCEEVNLMKPDGDKLQDPPLIIDNNMWKLNLEFKGTYPLVPCYIDCESKYLSPYGKAILLKFVNQEVIRTKYNEQPIFACLLKLENVELEQELMQYEKILELTLEQSCLNLEAYSANRLEKSFYCKVKKQIKENANTNTRQKITQVSSLLFMYKSLNNEIKYEKSTLFNSPSENILVEDIYSEYSLIDTLNITAETDLQQKDFSYKSNKNQASRKQFSLRAQCNCMYTKLKNEELYNKYLPERQQLPVYEHKEELFDIIENNTLIIITTETGAGKSSNLPEIIMERQPDCKILITEPRRISAVSLAMRVRQESGYDSSKIIGFSVKGKADYDESTVILYCTIGVIVRKFINDVASLGQYTHIIIDEVHERDVNTDLFLTMLKHEYENSKMQLPKLIIMSATVDGELFGKYYALPNTAYYALEGRMFKSTTYFLDDLVSKGILEVEYQGDVKRNQLYGDDDSDDYDSCKIDDFSLNYDSIVDILHKCIYVERNKGNTLVFLPGQFEIEKTIDKITSSGWFNDFEVLACHSMISLQDQENLFKASQHNRIICSTNIAEASVTLPNIIAVIDTGLERSVKYYPKQRKHIFSTQFISKQSAKERWGRAGRVCEGLVFCTYLEETYNNFEEERQPEIVKSSLTNAILQLCLLSENQPFDELSLLSEPQIFLKDVLTPPKDSFILQNLKELYNANFIEVFTDLTTSIDDKLLSKNSLLKLTHFGRDTAFLPIEPIYGKILFVAKEFNIDENLAKMLVATLSVGENEVLKEINPECKQLAHFSDHLLLIKILELFLEKKNIKEYNASFEGLEQMADTLNELNGKYSFKEENLLVPLLQISLWPNVAYFSPENKSLLSVKNKNSEYKIHPGSCCFENRPRIVLFTEQLVTSQNFLTTCSPGSVTALAYSAEDAEIDYRHSCLILQNIEFSTNCREASILLRFIEVMKTYGEGYELYKEFMQSEYE